LRYTGLSTLRPAKVPVTAPTDIRPRNLTNRNQSGAAYNDGKDLDTMFLAYRVAISPVPEPGSALLLGLGGALLMGAIRQRRARAAA
jgi:hypothetical protein